MPVIALVSMKGGVGKTTVTLGLASAGWHRGDRVLVIDADPLANASGVLGTGGPDTGVDADTAGTPSPSRWGPQVLVASGCLPATPCSVADGNLASIRDAYDLVLIDSPPSLGDLSLAAMRGADIAVIVTEPGFFSLQGAHRPLEAIAAIRRAENPRLGTATIVLNRLRSTIAEHAACDIQLRAVYGQLVNATVIPERFAVQQAQALRVPLHSWQSPAGRELSRIYDTLYAHLRG
ncbi:MAG: ParA family protein [Actinomycetales bacterium]|nr:ParA family protein [Actinomycetales bacterium]